MQYFQIGQDNQGSSSCNTCCCDAATAKAGETDLWKLAYAGWVNPIGGRGITQSPSVEIKLMTGPQQTGNLPPVVSPFFGITANATDFTGNLIGSAVDPEANALTFAALPLYAPSNGSVVISPSGAFVYTPNASFAGYDRFFYSVKDVYNLPVVGEVIIGVSPASPLPMLPLPTIAMVTPAIIVRNSAISINNIQSIVSFPLEVSPQAKKGETYRMTVRQPASDCDGNIFWRENCFDILITKCGA